MIHYRASWVVPVSAPPIRDGWVATDTGRIVACGRAADRTGPAADRSVDQEIVLGEAAILPGLVNAHTHLELSYLRDQLAPSSSFVAWIRGVMAARRERPDPEAPEILDAVDRAIAESIACGTALVGDITNTLVTI